MDSDHEISTENDAAQNTEISRDKLRYPNMPKEILDRLAKDIATDKVFCSTSLRDPNLIGSVFMPLLFGALKDLTKAQIEDIGFICEYYDKAGPMSVNGYPTFFSCCIVSKADARRIDGKVKRIRKMLKEI